MTDLPERIVAGAARLLPHSRRDWGAAMHAELAQVRGADSRWKFALGAVRAALTAPPGPGDGTPSIAAAVTFLAGIVGCLGVTAYVLATWPHAADAIPGSTAITFTATLAVYFWFAVRPPHFVVAHRDAARYGAQAGFVFFILSVLGGEIVNRFGPPGDDSWLGLVLIPCALGILAGVAFMQARNEQSFGAGLTAAFWAGLVCSILAFNGSLYGLLGGYNLDGHIAATMPSKTGVMPLPDVFMSKHVGDHLEASMRSLLRLPLLALVLGSIGALVGRGMGRLRRDRSVIVVA